MNQEIVLNEHYKTEYPPMHTAEHILNQTMVRMFGCARSRNTHIERKKSKCDYDACTCIGAHVSNTKLQNCDYDGCITSGKFRDWQLSVFIPF
jgi:Ser-tRNA(Ala) deacylase AlaX